MRMAVPPPSSRGRPGQRLQVDCMHFQPVGVEQPSAPLSSAPVRGNVPWGGSPDEVGSNAACVDVRMRKKKEKRKKKGESLWPISDCGEHEMTSIDASEHLRWHRP